MQRKDAAVVYRIALSAVVIALYFVVMLAMATVSFGAYQIRLATALYALALPFPFLTLPLAIANCLSNVLGGMVWDIVGGFFVGLFTAGSIALSSKIKGKLKYIIVVFAIEFIPSLVVPLWLAPLLSLPYWVLAASLLVGQIAPAILGALAVMFLEKRFKSLNLKVFGVGGGSKSAQSVSKAGSNEAENQKNDVELGVVEDQCLKQLGAVETNFSINGGTSAQGLNPADSAFGIDLENIVDVVADEINCDSDTASAKGITSDAVKFNDVAMQAEVAAAKVLQDIKAADAVYIDDETNLKIKKAARTPNIAAEDEEKT